ncbi:LysM domain-containing protein, partial [Metarhizium majus ARSEF 297]
MPVEVFGDPVCDIGGARSVLEGLCRPGCHPERGLHSQPKRRRVFEQSNIYRQVRNFNVDIRQTMTKKTAAFHWQVAQATSMTNVYIYASTDPGATQMGPLTENGSGGFLSDVYISGGKYGICADGGIQQYTVRHFEVHGQTDSCIVLIWDWGWTWYGLYLDSAPNGFSLLNPEADGAARTPTGSVYVMDSLFLNIKTGIKTNALKKEIKESTII